MPNFSHHPRITTATTEVCVIPLRVQTTSHTLLLNLQRATKPYRHHQTSRRNTSDSRSPALSMQQASLHPLYWTTFSLVAVPSIKIFPSLAARKAAQPYRNLYRLVGAATLSSPAETLSKISSHLCNSFKFPVLKLWLPIFQRPNFSFTDPLPRLSPASLGIHPFVTSQPPTHSQTLTTHSPQTADHHRLSFPHVRSQMLVVHYE